MIAIPAVDVRGGRCVQLVRGRPEDERVSLPDPVAVAAKWKEEGFDSLHVVDLDAALGSGDNTGTLLRIVGAASGDVQVGGGIRSSQRARSLLEGGVDRVVVGTRAVVDPAWLSELTHAWPARVIVAVDTAEGRILRKGWTESTTLGVQRFLPTLAPLPLAAVLWTDVDREGGLEGIDRRACARIIELSPHPVIISGGITSLDELAWLDAAGAHAVVLGMAIYTETLNGREVAGLWGSRETPAAGPRNNPSHG